MPLLLGVHALRTYLKLICKYELYTLPNKIVNGAKDHTSRSDFPWSAIFSVIVCSKNRTCGKSISIPENIVVVNVD